MCGADSRKASCLGKRRLSNLSSQRLHSGGGGGAGSGAGRELDGDIKSEAPSLEKPHRATPGLQDPCWLQPLQPREVSLGHIWEGSNQHLLPTRLGLAPPHRAAAAWCPRKPWGHRTLTHPRTHAGSSSRPTSKPESRSPPVPPGPLAHKWLGTWSRVLPTH